MISLPLLGLTLIIGLGPGVQNAGFRECPKGLYGFDPVLDIFCQSISEMNHNAEAPAGIPVQPTGKIPPPVEGSLCKPPARMTENGCQLPARTR